MTHMQKTFSTFPFSHSGSGTKFRSPGPKLRCPGIKSCRMPQTTGSVTFVENIEHV